MGRVRLEALEGEKEREKCFSYTTISNIKRILKKYELFTILT